MKKFNILIIIILCCMYATGQKRPLKDAIDFQLPKEAVKANKEKLKVIRKNNKAHGTDFSDYNNGEIYQSGTAIIYINAGKGKSTPPDFMERRKSGLDRIINMRGDISNYKSEITKINGNEVLVIEYDNLDLSYYRFYIKNTPTSTLAGVIEAEGGEKDKYKQILKELIKSVKFKD